MCNICKSRAEGTMTAEEARRAAREMILTVDDEYGEEMEHYLDVTIALDEEEDNKK